jgi:glycosyltransferase involved in cell wall biosynthesis
LATLALNLDPSRWRVHVIFQLPGGHWQSRFESAGIRLHQLRLSSYFSPAALGEALALRRYLATHDIRICHGFDYTTNVFVTPVARSVANVLTLSTQRCQHRLIPGKYQALTRLAHRTAHGVVVNSRDAGEEVIAGAGVPASRVHLLPNAIDTSVFSPEPRAKLPALPAGDTVIGAVCVLRQEKNLGTLLEAFARLLPAHPHTSLLIVGDGPDREALKEQAGRLGIAAKTFFPGATADVAAHMRSIDVFVMSSVSESSPNSLMEAMSCGCAPLASELPGNLEVLPEAARALVFPPLDADALASRLAAMLADSARREDLARAARRRIEQSYSIPTIVQQVESLYLRLLGENRVG